MSYYVEYNPELGRQYPAIVRHSRKSVSRVALFALSAAVTAYAVLHYGVFKYILPGNPAITKAAFSTLVAEVESGEPVKDALVNFCEEIITGNP